MASLNEETDVSIHEGRLHCDILSVGENSSLIGTTPLDETEDVVPSKSHRHERKFREYPRRYSPSAVQAGRVVPQLEEDLLHLEGSREGLNEDGTTDCSSGDANVGLGEVEDVVPETGLTVVLHFGKVEVGTESTSDLLFCIVEEEEGEIEDGGGDGGVVDSETGLVKVPSSGTGARR